MVRLLELLPQRREDWASLLIVSIAVLVGVPLWWLTTTVKRATLPLSRIEEFDNINERLFYDSDEEKMMLMPAATSVEVLLILAVAEPNAMHVEWNCGSAMEQILSPLSAALRPVINITFVAKTLYYVDAKTALSSKTKQHTLSTIGISSLVTNVENSLGSVLTSSPIIHAVLYIPRPSVTPLYIIRNGTAAPNNQVVLPRWGVIKVAHALFNNNTAENGSAVKLELNDYLNEWLPEIFSLLGLPATSEKHARKILGLWSRQDFERSVRKLTLRYLGSAISSLKSLASLLHKIRSIVINDHVAANVHLSVNKAADAERLHASGKIFEAVEASARAFEYAGFLNYCETESAFFDPSLLELLYFPDDQKYAVYIPLFLPIGLPIVLSVLSALKSLLQKVRRKESASATGEKAKIE